ncbi:endonuclease G, mitochondrial [Scyliorhinus canicula]|uniref:endonuclease G, mitochondrial n=1 Tax=Scyliorhinus canicula TaxID=7830 RepID=UPI0018F79977|nr:endonuclease G, mitochondrial [Scyliorhinus canicula]
MRRLLESRWLLAGFSLAAGVGLGLAWRREVPAVAAASLVPPQAPASVPPQAPASVPPQAPASVPPAALMRFGLPAGPQLRSRDSYLLAYEPRTRNAAWVLEQLEAGRLGLGRSERALCRFREDESLHQYHRARNSDFRGSGLDRGHLAAAANHSHSQRSLDDTFYLSNVVPQNPNLNKNVWNNLEKYCRSLTKSNKNVYICTGPLYLPRMEPDGKMYVKYQVIGENNVAVPTHIFKVVILEKHSGEIELQSYVMPNQPIMEKTPLERFLVPIESIERASGLLFVSNILKRTNKLTAITAGDK